MRLLVLGGTLFVGHAIVAEAVARGHSVTVVHRGRTGEAPGGARVVLGDRTSPQTLAALAAAGPWDAVLDAWSGAAGVVQASARALARAAGTYAYVSSRSVYTWPLPHGADETAPLVDADPGADEVDYATDKRGGELAVLESFPSALIARPGLILGPREFPGRLPWWLSRLIRGGDVLAPGPADLRLQYVDARDLAAFLLDGLESGLTGAFDTVSAPGHATMATLLGAAVDAVGPAVQAPVRLQWVDPSFLLERGVAPWTQVPVWVPEGHEAYALHDGDTSRALAAGLRCRPVEETVADTWAWWDAAGRPASVIRTGLGLEPDVEERLLREWAVRGVDVEHELTEDRPGT
ncbi:MAG: NAD-dependent epimerase/dehydratase family protein [Kineosporiaceae bacterium]